MENAFKQLGLESSATVNEIRIAYRNLARRWHPDRFEAGPERLWAEDRMIRINIAYEQALAHCATCSTTSVMEGSYSDEIEGDLMRDVRELLKLNQLEAARQALMRANSRHAEWNYLFGAILMRKGEFDKAMIYFGIAAKQSPDNLQYKAALASIQIIIARKKTPLFERVTSSLFGTHKQKGV